jgi:predicted DNA-binding transcriptional regulator AlpA
MTLRLESLIDKFITGPELRRRCGDVSDMTIWRWSNDPRLNFPRPMKIRRRNYYREREVLDWIERRMGAAQQSKSASLAPVACDDRAP